ncbi:hypothetical protein K491DRAFT_587937 [Lophiostoma macrostomum CBS 122681]|uniref:Heme oxygenase-like protein n=1 Tax=Lophiostoma macrostomum CBS 122681 TaxID=1314788 RepID=A0A6A6TLV0_9PLEO|nr:hypothetical protein K491DRAFT_587937 [Lophiostoma macrostomum CBS 122681]
MFVLQTTIAILIAFLAVVAYNEIQNRLAKGRARRKDVETPNNPKITTTEQVEPLQDNPEGLSALDESSSSYKEMEMYKELYLKLHSLEHHPEILPKCRDVLVSLLSESIADAQKEETDTILSVPAFNRETLCHFLKSKDVDVTNRYEEYVARRKAGGPPEMFSDKIEAAWWLKQAAPVKYVDGAWLGHINKITTPFRYRHITKNAWQVMSEELGDGDLAKNHVHVYRELMKNIKAGLPEADAEDFIHPRHELNEARCWKAAIAQLLVSLFPHDFLPEALGFNMAYESLPLHLLKTIKELREFKLNAYYFELHVSIDNADSGHSAMAMAAVVDYLELVTEEEGLDAAHTAWKRVQAGYILAEGLPTTPESPSLKQVKEDPFPRDDTEAALLEIFKAKSPVAHKIHCSSRLKIGRQSLVDWLEPNAFLDPEWQKNFLHDLGNCRPWVSKGDSGKSRLVKEVSWEGKMFGSFTQTEVETMKAWIDSLGAPSQMTTADPQVYLDFTGRHGGLLSSAGKDVFVHYPVFNDVPRHSETTAPPSEFSISSINTNCLDITRLIPLWFAASALLECLPSVPVRASDAFGSALVCVLRAQTGFSDEGPGVAGMDEVRRTDDGQAIGLVELGIEMCERAGLGRPKTFNDAVAIGGDRGRKVAEWMVSMSMRWLACKDVLVGVAWVFAQLHSRVAESESDQNIGILRVDSQEVLKHIAEREMRGLRIARDEIWRNDRRRARFEEGVSFALGEIYRCVFE